MAGVVVVAGVYPQGSVVRLFRLADEQVLAPAGSEEVGRALVDEGGIVGWDGLEVGVKYLAEGYVAGNYTTVRVTATDAEAPSMELAQPPILPKEGTIGTQQDPPRPELPAPPEGELPVGAPAGTPPPFVEPERLYAPLEDQPVESDEWSATGLQTPSTTTSDGSVLSPRPLYSWAGDGEPDLGDDFEHYEGPTEPAPGPVPSESAGTGEANGAPSEQAEGVTAPTTGASTSTDQPVSTTGEHPVQPELQHDPSAPTPPQTPTDGQDAGQPPAAGQDAPPPDTTVSPEPPTVAPSTGEAAQEPSGAPAPDAPADAGGPSTAPPAA